MFALVVAVAMAGLAAPLTSSFVYQGFLRDGNGPANGVYEIHFRLYDAATNGTLLAAEIIQPSVAVINGVFSTSLDFGTNAFTGEARWLEIGVRNGGNGDFVTLSPRQPLAPTPYALYALTPAGPQGAAGATGPQGVQGLQGVPGLAWRGAWDGGASYATNDAVQNGGSAWVAKLANTGVTPTEGASWTLLAQKGDPGPQGATGAAGSIGPQGSTGLTGATGATGPQGVPGLTWRGAWSVSTSYATNDAVQNGGSAWLATLANTGVTPTEGASWTMLAQKGDPGSTGPQGATGATGSTGPTGATGTTGTTGAQGATGAAGSQGAQGPQGVPGLTWRGAWDSGTNYATNDAVQSGGSAWVAKLANTGVTPIEGASWTILALKGATGSQGATGATGSIGPTGATGLMGATGATGPQGVPGLTWRGAWSVSTSYATNDAVQSGGPAWVATLPNTGILPTAGTNWTMLAQKGDPGPAGPTGATGPQGATGTTGSIGPQGSAGLMGATGPQGASGATGLQGAQGPQGVPGLTWRGAWDSGTNYATNDAVQSGGSAWVAKLANTGVTPIEGASWTMLAQKGDNGSQGATGATGSIGPTGATGLMGATGATGPQGVPGLTWRGAWSVSTSYATNDAVQSGGSAWVAKLANTGVTPVEGTSWTMLAQKGDTGPQGATGTTGSTGPTGATGTTGATGAQGATGAAGSQGAQGPQGVPGLTWRGAWSVSTSYATNDAVQSGGSAWVAKLASTGVVPVEGASWTLLAQKGDTGPQGATGATGSIGPTGATGTTGATGATGAAGHAGIDVAGGVERERQLCHQRRRAERRFRLGGQVR